MRKILTAAMLASALNVSASAADDAKLLETLALLLGRARTACAAFAERRPPSELSEVVMTPQVQWLKDGSLALVDVCRDVVNAKLLVDLTAAVKRYESQPK
jgi:hypothetical protein